MQLAINGGAKIRTNTFPGQEMTGQEELETIISLLKNNKFLSNYRGSWNDQFFGGEQIQLLEQEWQSYFGVKHAIACNSCTSALIIACGAIDIQPIDEIVVTPWSMSCSATAPMWYGGRPIFADIEKDYFCLDPMSIEKKITSKTKAIIMVDLFGQPYDVETIKKIANNYGLYIIEDAAQAIGSKYKNQYAGTLGDIGCFSLTTGKHLTAGEGGIIVTNNDELALKCRLIMNHAEAVTNDKIDKETDYMHYQYDLDMIGFNMRMTEIQAAITREQLKKLDRFITERNYRVEYLNKGLNSIPFINTTPIRNDCTHSYYVHAFKYYNEIIDRDKFINAVKAELTGEAGRFDRPLLNCGYIKPLYLFPLFKRQNHWTLRQEGWSIYYDQLCPMVEKLWKQDLFLSMYHNLSLTENDMDDIIEAFYKVAENIEELK